MKIDTGDSDEAVEEGLMVALINTELDLENERQRVKFLLARTNALEEEVANWHRHLSAVMPPDFKDWHQNSKSEWPLVAALVITGLREQVEQLLEQATNERRS